MSHYFNGVGAYFDRLAKAKLRNPKPGAEYERLLAEWLEKDKFAKDTFRTLTANPDTAGDYDYRKAVIKPIELAMDVVWKQLFCKHKQIDSIGGQRFVCGGFFDNEHDICRECGAEGVAGIDFHKKIITSKAAKSNYVQEIP